MWRVRKYGLSIGRLWMGDISLMDVPTLFLLDALTVLFLSPPKLHFDPDHDAEVRYVILICNSDLRNCTNYFQ
jgi:hypothetical protein